MGDRVGGFGQIIQLLRLAFVPALICRQRHAHGRGGIGSRTLRDHVGDGLRHLAVGPADDEFNLGRVYSSIKYFYFTILIPRYIIVSQQEGKIVILSHCSHSSHAYSRATAARICALIFSASSVRAITAATHSRRPRSTRSTR